VQNASHLLTFATPLPSIANELSIPGIEPYRHRKRNRPGSPGTLANLVDWQTSADSIEKLAFRAAVI